MASGSFINFAGYRYLKLSLLMLAAAIAAYVWHQPMGGPNGGTWLGFTLGGLGAFIILLLLWLGIRKRRYRSRLGTVRGWLSAHVYLGLSLPVIATLHAGFQFHWNIHTLAWVLTLLVVLSGIWGAVIYLRNPRLMAMQGQGESSEMLLGAMRELEQECLQLADQAGPELHENVAAAFRPTRPPGRWARLLGRRGAGNVEADRHFSAGDETWELEANLAEELARSRDPHRVGRLRDLLDSVSRRRALSLQLGRELQLQAQLAIWLLFHVPLSLGLLAALLAHVISVFFYR